MRSVSTIPRKQPRSPRMPSTMNRLVRVSRNSAEPCSQSTLASAAPYTFLAASGGGYGEGVQVSCAEGPAP